MKASIAPLLVLIALLCSPTRVSGEELDAGARAVRLGHDGLALYETGQWAAALAQFEDANRAMHSPVLVLYMARCQRNLSRLLEAGALLEELLARPAREDAPTSWQNATRDARAELEALRRLIPSLRIRRVGVATATVDDEPVRPGELIHVNPGSHVIRGWSWDGRVHEHRVSLGEGDQDIEVALSFDVPRERPAVPSRPEVRFQSASSRTDSTTGNPWSAATWATGGVALAAAVLGTATGLLAKSQFDEVRSHCNGRICPRNLEDDADRARALANASTAAFVVTGVSAALSVTFALWPLEAKEPLSPRRR